MAYTTRGDPRCIKRDKPTPPPYVHTHGDYHQIQEEFTNTEFEDAMGIGREP
jgi:hypothetical protein